MVFFTMIICSVLYYTTCIFGMFVLLLFITLFLFLGYLNFFGNTDPNILNNFGSDDILASIARGLLTFVMVSLVCQ